jgi:ABC-type nitrate/sulfonate/bicarbonate transport system permease component
MDAAPRATTRWIEALALWVSIPLFLGAWQIASTAGLVNELLFPPPTKVAVALWHELMNGTLLLDLGMSVTRVVIGFASGAAVAIMVGLLTGRYQVISNLLAPIFQLLRPIPPIAFVPIVILWFGLSEWGKWFLVFWGVFFTVWVATHLAARRSGIDPRRTIAWHSRPVVDPGRNSAVRAADDFCRVTHRGEHLVLHAGRG